MCGMLSEILRKVDDLQGIEWASLNTKPAPNTQVLMDQCHLIRLLYLDTELTLAMFVNRTNSLAVQAALLRPALMLVDNRDSQQGVFALFTHLDLEVCFKFYTIFISQEKLT